MRIRRLIAAIAGSGLAAGAGYLVLYATILAITMGKPGPNPPPAPTTACEVVGGGGNCLATTICETATCTPSNTELDACTCTVGNGLGAPNIHFHSSDPLPPKKFPAIVTFVADGDWPIAGTFTDISFGTTVTPNGSMTVEFDLGQSSSGEAVFLATVTHLGIRFPAPQGVESNVDLPPISIGLARLLPFDAPWIFRRNLSTGLSEPVSAASLLTIRPDNGSTDGWVGILFSTPTYGVTLQGKATGILDFANGSWSLRFSASACPNGRAICDINGDGQVARDDIQAIMAARGTQATPDDSRDADGDGVITVNDARICVLACTKPECAP